MREGMDIDSNEFFERSLSKFAGIRFTGDLPVGSIIGYQKHIMREDDYSRIDDILATHTIDLPINLRLPLSLAVFNSTHHEIIHQKLATFSGT